MKASYDAEVDALFVRFTCASIVDSEQVSPDMIVDFDADGHIVGIEILNAKLRHGDRLTPSDLALA